jgi:putative ABC transport system ATP-binding protein
MTVLNLKNVCFRYAQHSQDVISIDDFVMTEGETVFMYGPSGSGKTTLLGLIAGLFNPGAGSVSVLGRTMSSMSSSARDKFRAEQIGFIFQAFNLVPYLSVLENVVLPCQFGRRKSADFSSIADEASFLLSRLGLAGFERNDVTKLSIGQQQRVAAARALIGSPGLIIADEPTSALDADSRSDFLKLLFEQVQREKSSILFVSHDRSLASQFRRAQALEEINRVSSVLSRGQGS